MLNALNESMMLRKSAQYFAHDDYMMDCPNRILERVLLHEGTWLGQRSEQMDVRLWNIEKLISSDCEDDRLSCKMEVK